VRDVDEKQPGRGEESATVVEPVDPLARTLQRRPDAKRLRKGEAVGRYLILGVLGQGGMAVVYKGYDPELDRRVAIKLLAIDSSDETDVDADAARRRLLREAQAMAQLAHPNVVSIYDVGMHGEQVFIAMELVDRGTVGDWLHEEPRGWREIVEVFRQAGRGLEAAHAVRLVHRDVKPSNMLLGRDGRVRVTDFGIVKQVDDVDPKPVVPRPKPALEQPSDPLLASTMTDAGSMMGTLGFMAPEQIEGGPVDARADQFGFCVSLYRAHFDDALPFERSPRGETKVEATEPKDGRVPAWVTRVVMRGLRIAPEERYPSMSELLAALESDPARSRRLWTIGAVVAALVTALAAVAVASVIQRRNQTAALCQGATAQLSGVWDDARKRAVHAAFTAVNEPYAEDAYRHVERTLDAYARDWATMQTESCRATKIRGEQSTELLDLRTACLDRRLDELRAETELFARADAKVVLNAVQAAGALTRLEECANVVSLRTPLPPPTDPATRTKIVEVGRRLAEAKALLEAGKYSEGIAVAGPAADEARLLGYRPLEGEALFQLGWLEEKAGDPKIAEATLLDALVAAEAGRDDSMATSALTELVYLVGYVEARPKEAQVLSRQAFAIVERMGGDDELLAALNWRVGSTYYQQGQYADMLASDQKAASLWEHLRGPEDRHLAMVMSDTANALGMLGRQEEALATYRRAMALGPSHPDVGQLLVIIGWVLSLMKRYDEALEVDRRAVAIFEKTVGADHVLSAYALNTMGWVLLAQGKHEEALKSFGRALEIWEQALGKDNPRTADPLTGMGLALLGQHEASLALVPIERARVMREANAQDALDLAETQFALARALGELHRDPARARELATKAREAYVAAHDHTQANFATLADIDAWLARAP
jgi:tetratricopeptide (TPR) repeat protein/tRNA A-37 threonylcarbamoyl transferase component Bud32